MFNPESDPSEPMIVDRDGKEPTHEANIVWDFIAIAIPTVSAFLLFCAIAYWMITQAMVTHLFGRAW